LIQGATNLQSLAKLCEIAAPDVSSVISARA
jgi:hypothetical protein